MEMGMAMSWAVCRFGGRGVVGLMIGKIGKPVVMSDLSVTKM
jgi:hypothetical protein